MTTMNPKKNPKARRRRNRLPDITRTHWDSAGNRRPLLWFERPTYIKGPKLRNGNGSKFDPVVEDGRHATT